uniref:NPH3 domain-containing protein n=1 Tax=Caenorhabditis tropicalis TaxID=1561998 RepID=A0A1I7T4A8_9PELO
MSRRKLRAVEYDRDYLNFDDDHEIRRLIATVEEVHLKHRDDSWTSQMLDETDPVKWTAELEKYFAEFGAPEGCSRAAAVDYVLSAAINKIYEQKGGDAELSSNHLKEQIAKLLEAHRDSQNPLNRLDYTSPKFTENARVLCSILGISAHHPDPKILMKAACLYISENLGEDVIAEETEEVLQKKKMLDIKSFPIGMEVPKNGAVHFSARLLRLISLKQLREVSRMINETLVEIQNLTMDMSKRADLSQVQYGR